MGMFDEVLLPCPICQRMTLVQSKSGKCELEVYEYPKVPPSVLSDLIYDTNFYPQVFTCRWCDCEFVLEAIFHIREYSEVHTTCSDEF